MSDVFADLDEGSFVMLAPAGPKAKAECKLSFVQFKATTPHKLQISFQRPVLEEIGGPRYDVSWHPGKRLLLVKARDQAPFESVSAPHGAVLMLRMPVPAGLVPGDNAVAPEFYVDAVGKRLLIEVPVEFGRRLALPSPTSPAAPVAKPAAAVSPDELAQGNREILKALGVTQRFPQELGGQRFTPGEASILEALYRGTELTTEALLAATHDPENGDDDRDVKIVEVWLSRLRAKLGPLRIEIKSIWGGRRCMPAASKGLLRELLAAADARELA